MNSEHILIEREPPLAWLIMNRPEKLNALTTGMWRGIREAFSELAEDDSIRVIIVRGAGDRAFSAGADIGEFERHLESRVESAVESGATEMALTAIERCAKPTIGAIRGRCIGGGCAIALGLDIRIAATDSTFGLTPARVGIGYPHSGVVRAVREMGPGAARQLFLTARHIDAWRAHEIGLVQELTEPESLMEIARSTAKQVAGNAPATIRAIRESMRQCMLPESEQNRDEVREKIRACFDSADYREGVQAFLEKRAPQFRDC